MTVFEAPDAATAAAAEIADVAAGHLSRNRIVRILSDEEMKAALQKAAAAPSMAPH